MNPKNPDCCHDVLICVSLFILRLAKAMQAKYWSDWLKSREREQGMQLSDPEITQHSRIFCQKNRICRIIGSAQNSEKVVKTE